MEMRTLLSLFDRYAQYQNGYTALTTILDAFLIPFRVYKSHTEREQALAALQTIAQRDTVVAIFEEVGRLSEGFHDPLGELFMLRVSQGKNGQFFTPEPICSFMASAVNADLAPGKSVIDPACGSGRMLLAAAKMNRKLLFYGADIDGLCVKLALANMLLHSLTAEIAHMNAITREFFSSYQTGTVLHQGYHYPYFCQYTNAEESVVWQSMHKLAPEPKPFVSMPPGSMGVQGTLF